MKSVFRFIKRLWVYYVVSYPIQSFTFFCPSPNQRKLSYREKEFDKILNGLLSYGFELVDLKTISGEVGVWFVVLLKPMNSTAAKLNLSLHDEIGLEQSIKSEDVEIGEVYHE
jgi:hypothetical protein